MTESRAQRLQRVAQLLATFIGERDIGSVSIGVLNSIATKQGTKGAKTLRLSMELSPEVER